MLPPQNSPLFRYRLNSGLLGPRALRHEPVGGDKLSIALHRDRKTHGMGTDYSAQLAYIKEGRAYLARAYQAAGIEADVTATVEQWDPNGFDWTKYYDGRVNFLGAEFNATSATVNIEQASWLQKFLSRDTVQVDLFAGTSVSGAAGPVPATTYVELHSRALKQRYVASQKIARTDTAQMYGGDADPSHEQLLYFGFDNQEINELKLGAVNGGWVAGEVSSAVPIYVAAGNGEHRIELNLQFQVEAHTQPVTGGIPQYFQTVEAQFHLRIHTQAGIITEKLRPDFYQSGLEGDFVATESIARRTFSYQLQIGDEVYLYADYFVHDLAGKYSAPGIPDVYSAILSAKIFPGSYFRITATTTTPTTRATGLLLYEALERTVQALTDEVDVFCSDYFGRTDRGYAVDGPGALTLFTGGFQVRGFPRLTDPPPLPDLPDLRKSLYTTWRELFDSLAAVYGLGWGLEWAIGTKGTLIQVIRVEPLSYFYGQEVVLDLSAAGSLAGTKTKVTEADHYQVASFGYASWQAETVGGLDEPNATRQWTTPLTRVSTTYTQLSKLSASGTLLEATRRDRYDATATTDTSHDATNFLVCLLRTGPVTFDTERDQLVLSASGIDSVPTAYNLRLTPARMLRTDHGRVLGAGIKDLPGAVVRTTAGTGNGALVCQLVGEPAPIAESADVPLTDLPAPLWRPEQVTLTDVPVSRTQAHQLLQRPTGRVRFRDERNEVREGWVLDFSHDAWQESADFTLLPCA